VLLSLSLLVAAAGCVEPVDTDLASSEDLAEEAPVEGAAAPAPAPPAWPICFNGNAPGGWMTRVGWTCEIKATGSNVCCDVNLGLTCARVPWHPTRTECTQVRNPNPIPNQP
jgi:hypothetical protein